VVDFRGNVRFVGAQESSNLLRFRVAGCFAALASSILWAAAEGQAATDVLVNNYDNFRTGANLSESILNVSNVKPETFGRLFSYSVDGAVFSQPLVVSGVSFLNGGLRDVVYVTTANNSVYAFDAQAVSGAPLWQTALTQLPNGSAATVSGIYSTPVIDRSSRTIYVVAGLMEGSRAKYVLHALDLSNGTEKSSGPVVIAGSVKVDSTLVPFEPTSTRIAVQRAALAIAQGKVIVAFGGDFFEGWVFSYDKANLQASPSIFCTTCVSRVAAISGIDYLNADCIFLGPGGGIWQAGRGPVVDTHEMVYFFTGNKAHIIRNGCTIPQNNNSCTACSVTGGCPCKGIGSPKVCRGPDTCIAHEAANHQLFDVNEALIQLNPAAGLELTGWFRPANWNDPGPNGLEVSDLDLGGSGPVLIPGTARLIGGGKQGVLYVLDTTPTPSCIPSLTNTCMSPALSNPVQSFHIAPPPAPPNDYYRHLFGGPVIWSRSADQGGSLAFVWRENDYLRSYPISKEFERCDTNNPPPSTSHNCSSSAQSKDFIDHHPGGILAISASGGDAETGIVWASTTRGLNGPGKLMAFKAAPERSTPTQLDKIWDSDFCEEDRLEMGSDFIPPTVANGKIYLATGGNKVDVFGLIAERECAAQPLLELPGPMLQ
jgi:PQQ-like domain